VVKSIGEEQNKFMKGHEGRICTIACSKDGLLVATGEEVQQGFNAAIITWDFEQKEMMYRVRFHRTSILSLTFSCDS
jgi:hypothetical protein